MANETDEALSKEVTRFLDKNVGTEKSSTATVYSILQDAFKEKEMFGNRERLSSLVSQIAEVERFRAYVSWIQKIESCQFVRFISLFEGGQFNWGCRAVISAV
ncbi:hypothetical protein OS493_026681 [Desmophyllum pertusum]|uniref:Uncharacterized protein n=1 Tax=Desmophyllum pertusum TaxID=174260 RepID=A0A9X0A205_9CNID|nr:hypothetical protein OS493_026681 [Desmophyllum pertusum]